MTQKTMICVVFTQLFLYHYPLPDDLVDRFNRALYHSTKNLETFSQWSNLLRKVYAQKLNS